MPEFYGQLALGYDPQCAPEKYYLVSPEGKHIHFPGKNDRPLCGLNSGLGWETISEKWEHLMPLCQRCESQQMRKG